MSSSLTTPNGVNQGFDNPYYSPATVVLGRPRLIVVFSVYKAGSVTYKAQNILGFFFFFFFFFSRVRRPHLRRRLKRVSQKNWTCRINQVTNTQGGAAGKIFPVHRREQRPLCQAITSYVFSFSFFYGALFCGGGGLGLGQLIMNRRGAFSGVCDWRSP